MKQQDFFRRRFTVAGQVQGVGFRPFVYRLAARGGLTGTVGNTTEGVRIDVQGSPAALDAFGHALRHELPPLARLTACTEEALPPLAGEEGFRIVPSQGHGGHSVLVSPDMGICPDCLRDMNDPANRRWRYAFTNCTNCGPRYTITRSIPYDRAVTSMRCFPLCADCAAEYADPLDRRFHAQPNACPVCGPRLWLVEVDRQQHAKGYPPAGEACVEGGTQAHTGTGSEGQRHRGVDADAQLPTGAERLPNTACPAVTGEAREAVAQAALARAAVLLREGHIVAIKGLGGFLLACDATCAAAVARLRQRKQRPHKPFAVMAADMETVRRVARPSSEAEALLTSPEKPIVLCRKRRGPDGPEAAASARPSKTQPDILPDIIAPDVPNVGLMLPYAPLHVALFAHCRDVGGPRLLVMTSGNVSGEPICLGNREALARLGGMADAFLLHDRDILVRADDSVLAVQESAPAQGENPALLFFRRARGYVPRPIFLKAQEDAPCVLACGPELKATLCLTRGNEAFVSQHLGDLHTVETFRFFEEVARHLENLLQVRPAALVCDAHPDFMSTRYAQERAAAEGLPCIPLQHHAAHAASVLTENHTAGPALALTLDGTGLGTDGTIWGGELLLMELAAPAWRRLGRLSPFALPGGDAAVREPWRMAQALLWQMEAAGVPVPACTLPWQEAQHAALPLLRQMVEKQLNCPRTSSCGRLFDAVAALLGLCERITYEGQAAIRLEAALPETPDWQRVRPCAWRVREEEAGWAQADDSRPPLELETHSMFASVLAGMQAGQTAAELSAAFHLGLAQGMADMAARAARRLRLRQVGLSGGVLQNATVAHLLAAALRAQGLDVLTHHELPAGDGGVALGQAAWGRSWLRRQTEEGASPAGSGA